MTIDRYAKAVLTVIAIGLILMGLNPWVQPTPTEAGLMDSQYQAIAPTRDGGLYILDNKNLRLRFCILNIEFNINKKTPPIFCLPWVNVK